MIEHCLHGAIAGPLEHGLLLLVQLEPPVRLLMLQAHAQPGRQKDDQQTEHGRSANGQAE